MFAAYGSACSGTPGSSGAERTIGLLVASTSVRGRVFMFSLGAESSPADVALKWILSRFTAAGTSTAVTPKPLDPGETAAKLSAGQDASSAPTYTSGEDLFKIGCNQRAPYTYHCRPGAEFIIPATSANGVGMRMDPDTGTPTGTVTIHHSE